MYSVNNEALRICSGAFKSSPISSLQAECNEIPPQLRHQQLALQYAIKLKANRENPAYDDIFHGDDPLADYESDASSSSEGKAESSDEEHRDTLKEKRKSLPPTFCGRLQEVATDCEVPFDLISHQGIPDVEPWLVRVPSIDYRLAVLPKAKTNPHQYKALYKEVVEFYGNYSHVYTDGSKKDEKVGSAAVWLDTTRKTRLPNGCSIFTAEASALIDALKLISESDTARFIIFTDSLSCLQAIENEDMSNTLIHTYLSDYTELVSNGKEVVMCWIPSHIGIEGNEKADAAAKSSLDDDITPMSVPYSDFLPKVREYFHNLWQGWWERRTDFLALIHPILNKKIYDPTLSRREQRALCRIRIGHSRLTHAHIMDKHAEKPMCAECNCRLSMKHIMVDCPKYQHERSSFLDGSTTEEIYNNSDRAIINFVKECGFLNLL